MKKIKLVVVEYHNEEVVFATKLDGVVAGKYFYGMKSSCSNLIPNDGILKVSMSDLKIDKDGLCCVNVPADAPFSNDKLELIWKSDVKETVYTAIRSCFS